MPSAVATSGPSTPIAGAFPSTSSTPIRSPNLLPPDQSLKFKLLEEAFRLATERNVTTLLLIAVHSAVEEIKEKGFSGAAQAAVIGGVAGVAPVPFIGASGSGVALVGRAGGGAVTGLGVAGVGPVAHDC